MLNAILEFKLKRAEDYYACFRIHDRQHKVSVRLGIPILIWGVSKSERRNGESGLYGFGRNQY